jgi:hypothetical protein
MTLIEEEMDTKIKEYLDKGRFEKVVDLCDEKLKSNPRNPLYKTCKAYALLQLRQFIRCKEIFLSIKPMNRFCSHPDTVIQFVYIQTAFG